MPLNDYQVQIDGGPILGGTGARVSGYRIEDLEGLGQLEPEAVDEQKVHEPGAYFGIDTQRMRNIDITLGVTGSTPTQTMQRFEALVQHWRMKGTILDERTLSMKLPGWGQTRILKGRPRTLVPQTMDQLRFGRIPVFLRFSAYDPRFYDETETVINVNSGVTYTVFNVGTEATHLTFSSDSSVSGDVYFRNITSGEYNALLAAHATSSMTFDHYRHRITDNPTGRSLLRGRIGGSTWWRVFGTQTVSVTGVSGNIRYRSAWAG